MNFSPCSFVPLDYFYVGSLHPDLRVLFYRYALTIKLVTIGFLLYTPIASATYVEDPGTDMWDPPGRNPLLFSLCRCWHPDYKRYILCELQPHYSNNHVAWAVYPFSAETHVVNDYLFERRDVQIIRLLRKAEAILCKTIVIYTRILPYYDMDYCPWHCKYRYRYC